ncbi:hypothetical protein TCAP_01615 [Tolypocladium capitatum]|uniref:Uncharacterized protein n=1 Tax=Tolypocladium capitatum TaxID=45235 RepID=A0A2K3QLQ3_9HYPO|nr:hypothetical protein TCAP_01615 [Tolypocladium capitatum]
MAGVCLGSYLQDAVSGRRVRPPQAIGSGGAAVIFGQNPPSAPTACPTSIDPDTLCTTPGRAIVDAISAKPGGSRG